VVPAALSAVSGVRISGTTAQEKGSHFLAHWEVACTEKEQEQQAEGKLVAVVVAVAMS
jgi:hypothetical protein